MHTNNIGNPDTLEYNNTMEALGLKQHIIEPTHKLGKNGPNLNRKYRSNRSTIHIHRQLHIRPQNSWNRTTAKKKNKMKN